MAQGWGDARWSGRPEQGRVSTRQSDQPRAELICTYTLSSTCGSRRRFKQRCRGEAYLVRFVDDFVVSFQFREDADAFQPRTGGAVRRIRPGVEPRRRPGCYSLGDWPRSLAAARRGEAETFEFLGFKHVCGLDRRGKFALIRIPASTVAGTFWLAPRMDH